MWLESINLSRLIRFSLSTIFMLSALGKLMDHTVSALSLSQLLGGMFLGLYYLTTSTTMNIAEMQDNVDKISQTSRWTGWAALAIMVIAFLTLPFTSSKSRAAHSASSSFVDRTATETAIANRRAVLIDARPVYQYVMGHLPGAINIPYDSENLVELVDKHSLKKQPIIVYCSSVHCNAAEVLTKKLRILGCDKVSIYLGGWEDWVHNKPAQLVK